MFWDLYCAAPERREQCDHSSEAKAFHDYVSNKMIHFDEAVQCTGGKFISIIALSPIFKQGFVSSGYGVNGIGHVSTPNSKYLKYGVESK